MKNKILCKVIRIIALSAAITVLQQMYGMGSAGIIAVAVACVAWAATADFEAHEEAIRHGSWDVVDEKEDAFDCSECDAMVQRRYNFCPKCGAKMDR